MKTTHPNRLSDTRQRDCVLPPHCCSLDRCRWCWCYRKCGYLHLHLHRLRAARDKISRAIAICAAKMLRVKVKMEKRALDFFVHLLDHTSLSSHISYFTDAKPHPSTHLPLHIRTEITLKNKSQIKEKEWRR